MRETIGGDGRGGQGGEVKGQRESEGEEGGQERQGGRKPFVASLSGIDESVHSQHGVRSFLVSEGPC